MANVADKQQSSVAKVLGSKAHDDVFVWQTPSENWIHCAITNDDLDRAEIIKMFGSDFTVKLDEFSLTSFFVRNDKIAKTF